MQDLYHQPYGEDVMASGLVSAFGLGYRVQGFRVHAVCLPYLNFKP